MKVVGVTLHGGSSFIEGTGPRPIESGYLPLADFTGVLGRNDSGKSTLLGCVHDLLSGSAAMNGIAFADVGLERFDEILSHAISDLFRDIPPHNRFHYHEETRRQRGTWWANENNLTAKRIEAVEFTANDDLTEQWLEQIGSAYEGPDDESWRLVLDFLRSEAIESGRFVVGFEPEIRSASRTRNEWNLLLCLPPIAELPGRIVDALERSKVLDSEWAARGRAGDTSFFGAFAGGPRDHLQGPVVLAPMGRTEIALLPRPLYPRGSAGVLTQTEQALADCVAQLRWSDFLMAQGADPVEVDLDDVVLDPWVTSNGQDDWALSADIPLLCRKVEKMVSDVLPGSISKHYRIRVRVNSPEKWAESHLRFEVEPVDPDFFPHRSMTAQPGFIQIDRMAEGFRLWVNISILYVVNTIQLIASDLAVTNEHLRSWLSEPWADDPDGTQMVHSIRDDLADTLPKVRDPSRGMAVGASTELWFLDSEGVTSERDAAELTRGVLLVIDEPERFLHPKLQREMANWLGNSVTNGIPVLVATHSVPFMGIQGNTKYTYLLREGNSATHFGPIAPGELNDMGVAAEELGLDRGELLALTSLVLWVEGEMDREVLEKAFPSELRESGILVVPMQGYKHAKAKAVLETSLLRFSNAKVAVWLDGVDREYVASVMSNPKTAEEEARKAGAREPETVARLVHETKKLARSIEPIGVDSPGYDVFDLIDEEVIKERFPKFPGHKEARTRFDEKIEASQAQRGEWKNFWRKWFGVTVDEQTLGELAAEMRRTGRMTEPLRQVISRCQRLASER